MAAKQTPTSKKSSAPIPSGDAGVASSKGTRATTSKSRRVDVAAGARPANVVLAEAEHHFAHGRWREALATYAGVLQATPNSLKVRLRVADTLLNLNRHLEAISVYRTTATLALAAGFPLLGLVAVKMTLLMEPDDEVVIDAVVDGYTADGPRLDALYPGPPIPQAGDEACVTLAIDDDLIPQAARIGSQVKTDAPTSSLLPAIPLLSYLDDDGMRLVIDRLSLRRFSGEDLIVRQGERSESVFIIADGEVVIKRDADDLDDGTTLAVLRRGAVFGELALIADEPRHASAFAVGDADVFELRRSDLVVAAARSESVANALRQFTRERFLRHLMATHPFFSPLSRDDRHRVMDLTKVITLQGGDALIEEGKQGPGLFVLLGGAATVKKTIQRPNDASEMIHLATLKGGDLCGEISMLQDTPTNATVTATETLDALFLSRDAFKLVTSAHPELLRYLHSLTDERLRHNRAILGGRSRHDDEHVMI